MIFRTATKRSSALAMAFALATGTMVTAVAVEAPATAQKKKKEKAPKADYSKDFMKAYGAAQELLKADAIDEAAVRAAIPGIIAAVQTADDRNAAGSFLYSAGQKASDYELQLDGLSMMLESGKVEADRVGSFNNSAFQISNVLDRQADARKYLTAMADMNYSFEATLADGSKKTFSPDDIRLLIAESYVNEDDFAGALDYIERIIGERAAAGQAFPEDWVKRGFTIAYNNELNQRTFDFSKLYVEHHPSDASWGDAIAIVLNSRMFEEPEVLDILRLARRTGTFRESSMYLEYIDAADPRRLPGEVVALIDEGYAAGKLQRTDSFVTESRAEAERRMAADERELPELAADARAPGASLIDLVAAADTFLSYGKSAEAEEFYTKALTMSGVDTPRVLTRLGMAQLDQGKYAAAQESFGKVEGARKTIASLWAVYASQQM